MHLYEAHLPVSNTKAAQRFYVEIVGLQFAHRDLTRDAVFLWAGTDRRSMLGLCGPSTVHGAEFHKCHIAFNVPLAELLAAGERLRAAGIKTQNFSGEETTEPSVIGWMPSASCTSATGTVIRWSLSLCWTNFRIRGLSGRSQNGSSGTTLGEVSAASTHRASKGHLNHTSSCGNSESNCSSSRIPRNVALNFGLMTSAQIRQSFLDFFREKQHTIVPSSLLLPDAPNLLFTNAGMNQFVPIFLAQQKPPWKPPRVVDTQKCIRAGGKHNDLEDVGLDTYHHTFFEMLGNWSFGDYFKKEAIEWAWELVIELWQFPPQRLYATVYQPGPNEPSEFDQEAYDHWARLFRDADLDPKVHVLSSGKADNFWMMGDTGPCGPCSEVHMDLTPDGDTRGALVNKGDPRCIEIWNLVFIQFNAQPVPGGDDPGRMEFVPLPQRHVDTGMGFERAVAIIQGTRNFTDFSGTISNYDTDVFHPIFDELEKLSGKKYRSTLPIVGRLRETPAADTAALQNQNEQEKIDIAFRVIADHIRALSFAIADEIIPSNEGRGYVLRRILRRAVRYGRTLAFHEPFFFILVDVVATMMGDVFSELRAQKSKIKETIRRE